MLVYQRVDCLILPTRDPSRVDMQHYVNFCTMGTRYIAMISDVSYITSAIQ